MYLVDVSPPSGNPHAGVKLSLLANGKQEGEGAGPRGWGVRCILSTSKILQCWLFALLDCRGYGCRKVYLSASHDTSQIPWLPQRYGGTPAPLATLKCLKPDPDTQMGWLGLQPETCRRQEHTRQMYLSMSSEEVSQIYYFPLARPSEPNDRSFCQKEPSILFLQSKTCSACPSVLVRAGVPPVTSSIS